MSKRLRQRQILDIVADRALANQEELRRRLAGRGLRVTQATLSRDLKELGLVKTANGYALPSAVGASVPPFPTLSHLLREFVTDVREAQSLLVLKTSPGSAQPVAGALDSQQWPELAGTVAGDDTILVIPYSRPARRALAQRLREILA